MSDTNLINRLVNWCNHDIENPGCLACEVKLRLEELGAQIEKAEEDAEHQHADGLYDNETELCDLIERLEHEGKDLMLEGNSIMLDAAEALRALSVVDIETLNGALVSAEAQVAAMREALEPFAKLHERHAKRYRDRGGKPDSFPDTDPSFDVDALEIRLGAWRKASAALATPRPESQP